MENANDIESKNDNSQDEIQIEKPSYTYWKRESDQPFSKDFKPQKSEPSSQQTEENSLNYGSAWNKAGTWEEKHLPKIQLEEFFNKSLKNKNIVFGNSLLVDNISSYSGDVFKF